MKLYKIKKSKIDNKGRGLYATRDIKEGTKIIDYVGKIISNNLPLIELVVVKKIEIEILSLFCYF